mgnify:CR=1 FL=1
MSEKKYANVAVRLPEDTRVALTDGFRKKLTHAVEDILVAKRSRFTAVRLASAPDTSTRTFLSINADLAEALREAAQERCTSVGVLVYSLIADSAPASPSPRRERATPPLELRAA